MAPTKKDGDKEDKPKMTPQEATTCIHEYLRRTNRPYSPTEVSGNLKIGLTIAKKLLKDMHERQEIACCISGKQQVYHVIQDDIEPDHVEKLRAMSAETKRLTEDMNALRSEEKELRASLREGAGQISLVQLKGDVERKEKERIDLELRLKSLRDGNLKPVNPADRDRITKSYRTMKYVVTKRKKIRGEVWKMLMEAQQDSKAEELKEQLGLEF